MMSDIFIQLKGSSPKIYLKIFTMYEIFHHIKLQICINIYDVPYKGELHYRFLLLKYECNYIKKRYFCN